MARWGVATIVNGQVAGVSGCFRLRRSAERAARRKRSEIDLNALTVEGYRVVRRTSARSGDWGVRPEVADIYGSAAPPILTMPASSAPAVPSLEDENEDESVTR